jgi:hypothetical protein
MLSVICTIVSSTVLAQEFRLDSALGSTITYQIKLNPDTCWNRLRFIAKSYPYHYETYFGRPKKGDYIGTMQINPIKNESKKKTEIFFRVYVDDSASSLIRVYKGVYHDKTEWAFSLHNIFGLFDFVTVASPEPLDTPFNEEQLREISKIIAYVSRKD